MDGPNRGSWYRRNPIVAFRAERGGEERGEEVSESEEGGGGEERDASLRAWIGAGVWRLVRGEGARKGAVGRVPRPGAGAGGGGGGGRG